MKRTVVLNVVGLTSDLIGEHTPHLLKWMQGRHLTALRPVFPAVTCSVQATYLTGRTPAEHGIVGNGWFDRQDGEIKFWKQSNRLVAGEKLWDVLRSVHPEATVANVCWWYNMHTDVDYAVTPRPMYKADGRKIPDMATKPATLRDELRRNLGEFPLFQYWGPTASLESSDWIGRCAMHLERHHRPDLSLEYLPHLDYPLQKLGAQLPAIAQDVRAVDRLLGELLEFYGERGVETVVLSEYGIADVHRPVHLNRVLRQAGLVTVRDEGGQEHLDTWNSQAFAVCDHQVAHVYLQDISGLQHVQALLEAVPGVQHVLTPEQQRAWGVDHERAGDLVVVAEQDSWFTYYYWLDDGKAPDFARTVDIHRKPGYDPAELFFAPGGKARAGLRLLQRKLGFRALLDVVGLDATVVKGSHGLVSEDRQPVYISSIQRAASGDATDVFHWLLSTVLENRPPESQASRP